MATPEAPEYIGHPEPDPPARALSPRSNHAPHAAPPPPRRHPVIRLLDECDAAGGRAKALAFLVHPGPSLLVTGLTVGAAAMAQHAAPAPSTALRLVLLMLPAQFAIGTANDLADLAADRTSKPHKPLVRGAVPPPLAALMVATFTAVSLGSAASFGSAVTLATVVGLGAGLAYDAGLKRSAFSWLPWWVAFTALPVCAYAAVHRFTARLWWAVPLTAVLALALHSANALPDIDGDRRAGVVSLPVALGPRRARDVAVGGLLACAAGTATLFVPLHQTGPWLPLAWALTAACSLAAVVAPRIARRPFPLLALASGALALAWLASLPT